MKNKNSVVFKLSLKFALLLTFAMLSIIFIFFLLLRNSAIQNETKALSRTINQISRSILSNNPKNLEKKLSELPFFISYIIYDTNTKEIILQKNDKIPILPNAEKKPKRYTKKFDNDVISHRDLSFLYLTKNLKLPSGRQITLQIGSNSNNEIGNKFIINMILLIAAAGIPILFISFLISLFITKNTMNPVVKMTQAAAKISSTNLDTLLPVSSSNDELDILAKTFNSLFISLKKDFERERCFTGNVSHELKTPVAVILGQANLLRRWGKDDPHQLEKSLNIIINESRSMEQMISNLLELSKLDSKKIKLQKTEIPLLTFFERLKNETTAISSSAQIFVENKEDFIFVSDIELLHQLFTILISNSIKFSKNDAKIKIFWKENLSAKTLTFFVEDEGPGFDEEILPFIFQRFFRGDSAHVRKVGGSGIGLSVAKAITESLGGSITAENSKNHSALIKITLNKN